MIGKSGLYTITNNAFAAGHIAVNTSYTVNSSLELKNNAIASNTDIEFTGASLNFRVKKYGNTTSTTAAGTYWPSADYMVVGGGYMTPAIPTFTDNDATPSVLMYDKWIVTNSNPTTITTFHDGSPGQEISLIFTDNNTTIAETDNIKLGGAFSSTADDTMRLIYNGTNWYELSRSVN